MPRKKITYEMIWRNKLIDGGTTLESLIDALECAAKDLTVMRDAGVVLDPDGANDDYYFLKTQDAAVAAKFGFAKER